MAAGQPCEEGRYTIWMSADLDCRISNPGLSIYSRSAVVPETAPSDRSISSRVVRDRERVLLCRYPCDMGGNRRKWRPGTAATAFVDVRGVQGMHSMGPCKHLGAQDPPCCRTREWPSGEAGALDIAEWGNAPHGRKVPVGPCCCWAQPPILLRMYKLDASSESESKSS